MSDTLSDLPEDVAALIKPHVRLPQAVLDAIGIQIASRRDEAKGHRASSGIETTWAECEDAYAGIDDANRHEVNGISWNKATTPEGPVTTDGREPKGPDNRSTLFLRLTSRYVDAGVAKLTEILLPAGDKSFDFHEMPVPELIKALEDESQVVHNGVPQTRPLRPGETPPAAPSLAVGPGQAPPALAPVAQPVAAPGVAFPPQAGAPGAMPGAVAAPQPGGAATDQRVPLLVKDYAQEKIEFARKAAKAAEERIYDWMLQTQYRAEFRKVIADSARLGVGVLKAPVPENKRVIALTKDDNGDIARDDKGGVTIEIKETIVPAAKWVTPWNIFPDPASGENIHEGDYVFERDHMTARGVRGLKKLEGYIASQIDKVLEEGPNKVNATGSRNQSDEKSTKGRFEVWYFYGTLTKDEMAAIDQAAGLPPMDGLDHGPKEMHAIVTLINDSVVRAVINPLESGEFPYHSMPWQRRAGHWAGVGVAEQMRTPQRMTNASLRALLNNAGKSAGSQFVIDELAIVPADGKWEITPDKIWWKTNQGSNDVRQAFTTFQIPNMTQQLTEIIQLGQQFAEETTSIPLITQGQSGATTPDTFGAAQLQNNNANQLLRSIGYAFDDYITEPVIRQYYEWLLIDPKVPNEEKGEFQIDAHGSIALVERAIQDQSIAQMGGIAAPGNGFGIDPKKWAKEFLKSKRLDPESMTYSKEEQDKMDNAPPPEAPAVTVAKINADVAMKQLAATQTADQRTAEAEGQIAAAAHVLEVGRVQGDQQQAHIDATLRAHELESRRELALLDYANQHRLSLDQAKVALAKTAMQLQTERELNAQNNHLDLHKHHNPPPPVQVPGRAGNGQAFSQSRTVQ